MLLEIKKYLKFFIILVIFFNSGVLYSNQNYKDIYAQNKEEWLKLYYKESMQQYNYTYDNSERLVLSTYAYNYFLESVLKLHLPSYKIKKKNFEILYDSSLELKPTNNIILREIINPNNKSISEIMLSLDKRDGVENFALFYNLSRIAINMINTDITLYDVDTIYNKLSIDQIAIDMDYSVELLKDNINYSIFYIDKTVFFILKKTKLNESSSSQQTEEKTEIYDSTQNLDKENSDEFFDNENKDKIVSNKKEKEEINNKKLSPQEKQLEYIKNKNKIYSNEVVSRKDNKRSTFKTL